MDKDTAEYILAGLVAASILIYPASIKAYLLSWLDYPSNKQQMPIRAALWAVIGFMLLNNEATVYHGIAWYIIMIAGLILPIIAFTYISGGIGGIIAEKLFPEFEDVKKKSR